MYSLLVLIAAVAFTVGGIYMKLSAGLTQLIPSLLVYICFAVGASLQALAMRQSDLGVTYLVVRPKKILDEEYTKEVWQIDE